MFETKEELVESLVKLCQGYFDITRDTVIQEIPVTAEAAFFSRSEKYVLVKKAKLWAAEANEYMFFVLSDNLDEEFFDRCVEAFWKEGVGRIKPHREHMYTYVTLILLADSVSDEVKKKVKRISRHKDFLFSLHGWADFRVAVRDMSDGRTETNRMGKELIKIFAAAGK